MKTLANQRMNRDENTQGNISQPIHNANVHKNPYRFAIIIMSLIIFASAVLPGWFTINTEVQEIVDMDVRYDSNGIPHFDVPVYRYLKHGSLNFSMLLQASYNDHYTVECSPVVKSLAIFTFIYFILSLLMYATASRIHYSSFTINWSPVISIVLCVFQVLCFNQNNFDIYCSHSTNSSYNTGFVWWICLILLLVLVIYNIAINEKIPRIPMDKISNKQKQQRIVVKPKIVSTEIPGNSWCCGFCGHHNSLNSEFCVSCGYEHIEDK